MKHGVHEAALLREVNVEELLSLFLGHGGRKRLAVLDEMTKGDGHLAHWVRVGGGPEALELGDHSRQEVQSSPRAHGCRWTAPH